MELMGATILAMLAAIVAVVGAAVSKQLTVELGAWLPWITERTIVCAVRRLPQDQRQRFEEEWRSHRDEVPGDIGKLILALGYLRAARDMAPYLAPLSFAVSKRALDLCISSWGFLALSPLLLVVAISIKVDSKGPVFVRRTWRGYNNRRIGVIDFRTTASTSDDSITRVGYILRLTYFNQLPRLLNVLYGDMSLVGPAPYSDDVYEKVRDRLPPTSESCDVKPGIIGWAQVNSNWVDTETRLARDQYYAENRSIMFDLKIILVTLFRTKSRD